MSERRYFVYIMTSSSLSTMGFSFRLTFGKSSGGGSGGFGGGLI